MDLLDSAQWDVLWILQMSPIALENILLNKDLSTASWKVAWFLRAKVAMRQNFLPFLSICQFRRLNLLGFVLYWSMNPNFSGVEVSDWWEQLQLKCLWFQAGNRHICIVESQPKIKTEIISLFLSVFKCLKIDLILLDKIPPHKICCKIAHFIKLRSNSWSQLSVNDLYPCWKWNLQAHKCYRGHKQKHTN